MLYYLTNLLFFDIPLLHCYINLRSSIVLCLSYGDIYLSLGISSSCSKFLYFLYIFCMFFLTFSEQFCDDVLETF